MKRCILTAFDSNTIIMDIAYLTDQILPQTATDTAQLISMASALGTVLEETGGTLSIVMPRRILGRMATSQAVAEYYGVEPSFKVAGVRSVFPNIRGIEKLAQGWRAPASQRAQSADLMYTRTLPILITALAIDAGPIVYETYRPWPVQQPWSAGIFEWIGQHPNFLGAVLHSEYARRSYEVAGIPSERLLTAHNAYDPAMISNPVSRDEARRILGIATNDKVAVYSGRINSRKGLDVVLSMALALPHVLFMLVGSEGRGEVEAQADSLSNVVVVPWGPMVDTIRYLQAADILVIPPSEKPLAISGNTVLPIKTFLYLAVGKPILAGDTSDLTEILKDGYNARLVAPDRPDVAAEALESLFADDTLCAHLSRNALETVRDQTWRNRAATVLDFISSRL